MFRHPNWNYGREDNGLDWHRVYVRMDDDEAGIIIVGRNIGLYVTC